MEYAVLDINTGIQIEFDNRASVISWWRKKVGKLDFSLLNITGRDMYCAERLVYDGETPHVERNWYLRPYMVFDKYGRTIDIRDWPKEEWDIPNQFPQHNWDSFGRMPGRKRHFHRSGAPFGYRRMLREAGKGAGLDPEYEDADRGILFECEAPSIRKKSAISLYDYWDCCERAAFKSSDSSWKKNSRCRKQYQRHMNVHGRNGDVAKLCLGDEWYDAENAENKSLTTSKIGGLA